MTPNGIDTKQTLLTCLLLAILALGVFWRVQGFDFVNYDDGLYVYNNPEVQKGLTAQTVAWAISRPHIGHWHPLTWLSHMLDVELFGINPGGPHTVSLLLHILNTLLLFLVLTRITGTFWRSAAVAALFAIHPLHVEPVAWISARKDVLSTFFWCLTLSAYAGYVLRPTLARYLCVMLWFILGLAAKPMLVTLPFLLLLLDFWPLKRINPGDGHARCWMLLREKIPLFACSALSCLATYYAGLEHNVVGGFERFPMWTRIANAAVSYVAYIGKAIWPSHLAVFYPYPYEALPLWKSLGAIVLLVAATALVLRWGFRYRYLPVGWLWFVGTLVPVIGLVPIGGHAMADRYAYVPIVGLFIIAVWGANDLATRWGRSPKVLGVLAIGALAVCAWVQVGSWRDGETLCRHAVRVTKDNARMLNNLGLALRTQTRLEEAKAELIRAIEIRPKYHVAHNNLGLVLEDLGDMNGAVSRYRRAVALEPDYIQAHNNLGAAFIRLKRSAEAVPHFRESVRLSPGDFLARCNLGVALVANGEYEAACEQYRVAIQLEPEDPVAHFNLGLALANQGQLESARAAFAKTLELDPNYAAARRNIEHIDAALEQDQ